MDPQGPVNPEDETTTPEITDEHDEEADASSNESAGEFAPEGFERWRRESAVGSLGTGIARGLQHVFSPPPNQPVIVASVPGDPPDPERLVVILDPDDPSKSVALLPPAADAADAGEDDPRADSRFPENRRPTPESVDIPVRWT